MFYLNVGYVWFLFIYLSYSSLMVGLYIYVVCLFHLPLNNLPVFFVGSLPVEGSVDAQSDYGCVS